MKTAISIPDQVFRAAEELAKRLGLSRSELYVRAISALVEEHRDGFITARLNATYTETGPDSSLDRGLAALQSRSLGVEKW